jgi:hypothetical protein
VFYTGAGLSIASGIPSMDELEKSLYIERMGEELNAGAIITHADEVLENWNHFCQTIVTAQPSLGHYALALLAQKKGCAIFTENVDYLHQKSGIIPLMVQPHLKQDQDTVFFGEIDAIVCIGLSHDDRGLLAFYKECNPAGVIIAIDLKQPNYLGQEDMLLIGDAQKILPTLAEQIAGVQ